MNKYPKVRVAAVQAGPVYMDLDASVEKACVLIKDAAKKGAQLVGFPEAFLPGYPWWIWLDNPLAGMGLTEKLFRNAITVPGPAIQKISACAKENNIYVCISGTEIEGSTLYLTQFWFDNNGNLMGKHRKMKPSNAERTIWGDGDGSTMEVFDTPIGKLGGLMCFEHLIPANLMTLGAQGEQIHVASWPPLPEKPENIMSLMPNETATRHYCLANAAFSLFCTQVFNQDAVDMCCEGHPEYLKKLPTALNNGLGGGNSKIFDTTGEVISDTIPETEEGVVVADLDLSQSIGQKMLIDTVGHYTKPGCLHMVFNRNAEKSVHIEGEQVDNSISFGKLQED